MMTRASRMLSVFFMVFHFPFKVIWSFQLITSPGKPQAAASLTENLTRREKRGILFSPFGKENDSVKTWLRNNLFLTFCLLAGLACTLILCGVRAGLEQQHTGVSQSCISQHLQKLRAAGLVVSERSGNEVYYRAAECPDVARLVEALLDKEGERNGI